MTAAERKRLIEIKLIEALAPKELNIIDESHLHAGHPGARSGASHFAIEISSDAFEGINKVKQHQKIYAAVGDMIPTEIHALRIVIL
jgi:BolA protein